MFDPRSFTCKERKTVGEILGEILTVDKVVTEKKIVIETTSAKIQRNL